MDAAEIGPFLPCTLLHVDQMALAVCTDIVLQEGTYCYAKQIINGQGRKDESFLAMLKKAQTANFWVDFGAVHLLLGFVDTFSTLMQMLNLCFSNHP